MLTNKAKYGLRAMCALTGSAEDWLQAHAIAARANVPPKFLEAILVDLRKAALVRSRRGQTGGHALARAADAIMVGDVIRAIDGPLAPVRCASITAYRPCHDCADPSRCAVRALMRETRQALSGVLDHCSLATLAQRAGQETWMQSAIGDVPVGRISRRRNAPDATRDAEPIST
ncbi:RrF2 family transcriptional regulator [Montanilutibacter psychrotolerans]|uniref:Rrf2 family transcriptional regulator n=1 Tax=Montanilutibacter psychrotolerans TaxID=1327343 RepID=A0A3M8SRB4_9GAMM|nr:Rrf2 family transcriptional regulator [Lysobacter psychrotolerans]RNF83829.1 Rrf2 family transcriptional regulator [Lysobacter psychrotolerans]